MVGQVEWTERVQKKFQEAPPMFTKTVLKYCSMIALKTLPTSPFRVKSGGLDTAFRVLCTLAPVHSLSLMLPTCLCSVLLTSWICFGFFNGPWISQHQSAECFSIPSTWCPCAFPSPFVWPVPPRTIGLNTGHGDLGRAWQQVSSSTGNLNQPKCGGRKAELLKNCD